MKVRFFSSLPAIGVLALCATAFAADPASIPRLETAPAATAPAHDGLTLYFPGAQRIAPDAKGGLEIVQKNGTLRHYHPELYQVINGKRHVVPFSYHFVGTDHIELKPAQANPSVPLQVAPNPKHTNS